MNSKWLKKLPIIKQIVILQEEVRELQGELEEYRIRLQGMEERYRAVKVETKENIKSAETEIRKCIAETRYEIGKQMQYNFIRGLCPEQYKEAMCEWYYRYTGEQLNLINPQTFNQKIQWMKLYDNTKLKTELSDKYAVRDWVSKVIGENYLIPLLGAWDSFDEIDFDVLPNQFVLKANHGSGWNIIVKDKSDFNKEKASKKFHEWMGKNYAYEGFELHYKGIKPKIIAEQYVESKGDLYDYKFICLDEKPRYICVYSQRDVRTCNNIFDMDWNEQPFKMTYQRSGVHIPMPRNFEIMKELAEKLCKNFPLVRIDFYNVEGKIYFGEMTFTPGNGKGQIEPKEFNMKLGDMITLPEKKMFEGKML